jgi:hypothetical protein
METESRRSPILDIYELTKLSLLFIDWLTARVLRPFRSRPSTQQLPGYESTVCAAAWGGYSAKIARKQVRHRTSRRGHTAPGNLQRRIADGRPEPCSRLTADPSPDCR